MTTIKTRKSLEKQLLKAEKTANDFKFRAKQIKDKIKGKGLNSFIEFSLRANKIIFSYKNILFLYKPLQASLALKVA